MSFIVKFFTSRFLSFAVGGFLLLAAIGGGAALIWLTRRPSWDVLSASGPVGAAERNLLTISTLMMLVVVLIVFAITAYVVWKFRAGRGATYSPEWEGSRLLEGVWWAVPMVLIAILSVMTWKSTHDLEPSRPLAGGEPLRVQVVAMEWKWLFIYPDEQIATVNQLVVPTGRPLAFEITSDAPMNSFWIPALGSQIYAMSGMTTRLHLQADRAGTYAGVSANLSGAGFADMRFATRAVSPADYTTWVGEVRRSGGALTSDSYEQLRAPATAKPASYAVAQAGLYDDVVNKFMLPGISADGAEAGR